MADPLMLWISALLVVVMWAAALSALLLKSHLAAVVSTSLLSLGLSLLFVLLRAPDVALTEGVVGAGLSSLILALALIRLGLVGGSPREREVLSETVGDKPVTERGSQQ
ncbi:MAG: DUF4040 domain-containing protein [Gammaproteobacteria bacterium]|jgi:energy-converting hydrogenase B subunit D|nr:DUF4040 domain-containing protein [Gammaproteobacteria bacterium]MBT7308291.1 DUF4040 domain-containing protein [Gammaproteobacteria bacterium]